MNNDLISREALKKTIEPLIEDGRIYDILSYIDNAPTVEERPQGEWKFSQGVTTQGSLKCPFCDYRDYHNTNSNFCPNCGADMRGAV